MRLMNTHDLLFTEFTGEVNVPYAILSHRWEAERDEVSYKDYRKKLKRDTSGYSKIRNFCTVAREDGLDWAWIDTCCIDKRSSAELTQSINSMYSWYRKAATCYAYLKDVGPQTNWKTSEWWRRGWTLQELIASTRVIFYNQNWHKLGTKAEMAAQIKTSTGIPTAVLFDERACAQYCVAQRMSWAADRNTTCVEDRAYSLMGLFRINMPLLYGEGTKAFQRLQLEILQKYPDESVFAWALDVEEPHRVLATSPDSFASCANLVPRWQTWSSACMGPKPRMSNPPRVTSWGIELRANARKLFPRRELIVNGQPHEFLWAITLTVARDGRMRELPCVIVLIRSGPAPFAYRRFDCCYYDRYYDRTDDTYASYHGDFDLGDVETEKLFYLEFDQDLES